MFGSLLFLERQIAIPLIKIFEMQNGIQMRYKENIKWLELEK